MYILSNYYAMLFNDHEKIPGWTSCMEHHRIP